MTPEEMTQQEAQLHELALQVRNWGKWGPDAAISPPISSRAADCASDGRYDFMLVAPPLPVTRAVGTPINPYAMK